MRRSTLATASGASSESRCAVTGSRIGASRTPVCASCCRSSDFLPTPLAEGVHALREAMDRLEELDRDERHHLGHDLRVPLNAIAGWTHILRLDASSAATVHRAVDVFDRNIRALTRLIETYTSAGPER